MADHSVGSIGAEFTADTAGFTKGVETVKSSLEGLKTVAEAFALEKIFEGITDIALETTKAFDENAMALNRVSSATSGLQTEKFKELAEQLSHVSTYSMATTLNAAAMLGKFNLNDQIIAQMLPKLQNFAAFMGTDLSSAANQFGMAIASGEVSARRLGIALDDQQKAQFKASDAAGRAAILMEALGKYNGQAAAMADTATGAHQKFANQTEELSASIGTLLDKPVAAFYNGLTEKVRLLTDGFNTLKPEVKESIGNFAMAAGGMASTAVAAGGAWKAMSALGQFSGVAAGIGSGISTLKDGFKVLGDNIDMAQRSAVILGKADFGGIASTIKGIYTTVKDLAIASALAAGPWLLVAAAIAGVAAASIALYGIWKDKSISANTASGVIEGLKKGFTEGLQGIMGGVKEKFASLFEGNKLPGGEEKAGAKVAAGSGFKALGGAGINIDFSKLKDAFDDTALKVMELGQSFDDSAQNFDQITQSELSGLAALDDSTLQEIERAAITAQANQEQREYNQAIIDGFKADTAHANAMNAQRQDQSTALAASIVGPVDKDSSGGAQVASGVISGVQGQAGPMGQVMGAFASGGPMAGIVAIIMAVLESMKAFGTIMNTLNGIISMVGKILNPIIASIQPLLSGIFVALEQVLQPIGVLIQAIFVPLGQVFQAIGQVVMVFGAIIGDLVQIFLTNNPVFKLLELIMQGVAVVIKAVAEGLADAFNGVIDVWNALIDGLANVVNAILPGSLGDDAGNAIRGLQVSTINLDAMSAAAANTTSAMQGLTTSSENLPEGFKVALSNWQALSTTAEPTSTGTDMVTVATDFATAITNALTGHGGGSGTTAASVEAGMAFNPNFAGTMAAGVTAPAATGKSMMAMPSPVAAPSSSSTSSAVNIQSVTVQASTPDLLAAIQKKLANDGYLGSGTKSTTMGTTRSQWGH